MNAIYDDEVRAFVVKRPTHFIVIKSLGGGCFKVAPGKKVGVDYTGALWGGRHIAMEAKSSSTASMPLMRRGEPLFNASQVTELTAAMALKAVAVVLLKVTRQVDRKPCPEWYLLTWAGWNAAAGGAAAEGKASVSAFLLQTHGARVPMRGAKPDWLAALGLMEAVDEG